MIVRDLIAALQALPREAQDKPVVIQNAYPGEDAEGRPRYWDIDGLEERHIPWPTLKHYVDVVVIE